MNQELKTELKAIIWPTIVTLLVCGLIIGFWPHTDMYKQIWEAQRLEVQYHLRYELSLPYISSLFSREQLMAKYKLTEVDVALPDLALVNLSDNRGITHSPFVVLQTRIRPW